MGTVRVLGSLALVAGLALVGYAALQGDVSVHLVLVIPVITGTGPAAGLGALLAIAGGAALLFDLARSGASPHPPGRSDTPERAGSEQDAGRDGGSETRGGGVILIGPIPIAWGSDRESLGWVLVAAIVLTLLAVGLTLWLGRIQLS